MDAGELYLWIHPVSHGRSSGAMVWATGHYAPAFTTLDIIPVELYCAKLATVDRPDVA